MVRAYFLGGRNMGSIRTDFWRAHIQAYGSSGLRINEYCKQHGLAEGSFYKWRSRLSKLPLSSDFEELSVQEDQEECYSHMIDIGRIDHKILCIFVQSLLARHHARR